MTAAEILGAWLGELSSRELYDEATAFRRTLIAGYGEDGVTWETLSDDRIAAALTAWLGMSRPEFSDFPELPQDEALETATDVRLYLEQFQEPANRPSTLSVDQFAGALQVVRRVLSGEFGDGDGDGGGGAPEGERMNGKSGFRADFKLKPN